MPTTGGMVKYGRYPNKQTNILVVLALTFQCFRCTEVLCHGAAVNAYVG